METKNNKNIEFLEKEEKVEKENIDIDNKNNENIENKKNKINKTNIKKFLKNLGIIVGKDILRFILRIIEIVILIFGICYFINWSNDSINVTYDTYKNESIPNSFDNYKILQISDFNNKDDIANTLINKVKNVNPDIIVITGDYVNSDRCDKYNIDYTLLEELVKIYPIYFVTGEQEQDFRDYDEFKNKIEELGIEVLDNESIDIEKNNDKITLIGINDSAFFFENTTTLNKTIKKLNKENNFTILLAHRPELINIYTENKIPLVLAGHALGGQFNFPFIGPFYSSNQGFYPDFTSGFYKQEDTSLYVSRGVGNTFIPIRLFNNPEINVITLKKGSK